MGLEHKIAPSILSADFARLGEEVRRVEEAGADLIHFDVMDGHFVPNLSIGVPVLKSLRKITRLPLDAHLMISEPARYVRTFVEAGANSISVHAEVCDDLPGIAARIREFGARASVAINPETPVERVLAVAEHLDMILVMSVHPGFSGQEFIANSLDKVRSIRRDLERLQVGSKLNTLAAMDAKVEMERNLHAAEETVASGQRDLAALAAERDGYVQSWHADISEKLAEAAGKLSDARESLNKAQLRKQLVELRADRDATVLTVAKVSVGSVLQSGQQFITLVPLDAPLEVEANVAGRDDGFIAVGLESF